MLGGVLATLGIYRLYEKWLLRQVNGGSKPEHVAIILDGNRRWASEKALEPWLGHSYGAEKIEDLVTWCLDMGVKSVTLYAFSTENFQRSPTEVEILMQIIEKKLSDMLENEKIHRHRVRVKAIGRVELLPKTLQEWIRRVEETTKDYEDHFLNLALAYGGRAEIVDAAKEIAQKVKRGEMKTEDITEDAFEEYLYTSHLTKQDPDLIIRTSGEERMSGFLLWQSAYSELCFLDINWPDFRRIDFLRAVRTYQRRKRRFGQ